MGPLKGEENPRDNNSRKGNLNVDSSDAATQQIDSQFSPGGVLEANEADDFPYLTDTMPVDDTYLLEDAFETQWASLAGETQVMGDLAGETQVVGDFAGESQVVDLAGETQVLDDLDCLKSMPTEVLNEFNPEVDAVSKCEGTNKFDVMCETQELSQDDSVKIDGNDSVGLVSTVDKDPPREVWRGFTSIRAASIRASGLAAHAQGANRSLCTTRSDKSSLEQQTCEQDGSSPVGHLSKCSRKFDQECLDNECSDDESEKLRNSNKCKFGGTAVRKLFREKKDAEIGDSETDINHTDDSLDVPELFGSENCLAGLSYANSQEPGDLSQAHALEVVDRFLDLNFVEHDEGFGMRVHNAEKSKVVSSAKGSRDLARSSLLKSTVGDCGIYDWDDTREDDGGGEFFLKKKELFFQNGSPKQRCLTEPRKPRCSGHGTVKAAGGNVDEEGQKCTRNKLGDSMHSDSGFMLHKLRPKEKSLHGGEEVLQKNVVRNLDEQLHLVSRPNLAENDTDKDIPDMRNIGPDTQMAAEAMETLCFEVHLADSNGGPDKGVNSTAKAARVNKLRNKTAHSPQQLAPKIPHPTSVGVVTRQAKRLKRISINASNESSLSPKQSKKIRKRHDRVLVEAEQRSPVDVNVSAASHGIESTGRRSEEKPQKEDQLDFFVPVAHRTRKRTEANRSELAANSFDARYEINDPVSARVRGKRTAARDKNAEAVTIEKIKKVGTTGFNQSNGTCVDTSDIDAVDNLQVKRSRQETLAGTQQNERLKRSSEIAASILVNPDSNHLNHSSTCNYPALPCLDTQSRKVIAHQTVKNGSSRDPAAQCDSDHLNVKTILDVAVGTSISEQSDEKSDYGTSIEGAERNGKQEASPRCGTSSSTCATPANRTIPINNVSPICMGDEYHKQSCRKNLPVLSLTKETNNLVTGSPGAYSGMRESRKRKDITTIRVLFSQHLDVDVVKQQKKILARLGGAVASSISDATHFVADEFVRTRNMLEAIAFGKPVVTHLWIESCGQAGCLIDEKNFILRDARKEKEFGFCLPASLARACQHPLLQGQKVLVTPNTKPGKDILAKLVKAVHGLAVERLGRSVLKDKKLPDDLLILSCEEDYDACVPFLEKGGAIYSSELLLNGIVKQKLEYERHRLFADHVKRTRSTIWVKKKNRFLPVAK